MSTESEEDGTFCDLCKQKTRRGDFDPCHYCGDVCGRCETQGADGEASAHEQHHLDQFDNLLARMQKLEIVAKRAAGPPGERPWWGGRIDDDVKNQRAGDLLKALAAAGFKVE